MARGNYYQDVQNCAADRSNGYLYLYNNGNSSVSNTEGIYQSSDGVTWTRVANGFKTGANYAGDQQMRTVPGEAGELWLTYGRQGLGGTGHPQPTPLYHCSGLGTGSVSCPTISNIKEVFAIGFGAPLSAGYPAIYIYGYANCGQLRELPASGSGYTWASIVER